MREINSEGLRLICQWEGLYLTAYHGAADRPGLLTIGYGHTDAAGPPAVKAGMTITKTEAENILRADLRKVEVSVESLVKVPLTDNQFAALVSFVFNVGQANFAKSTLLRKLNAGDYDAVPAELMKWANANGKRVQGLVNRRAAEAGLWAKGAFVASQYVEPEAGNKNAFASPEAISGYAGSGAAVLAAVSNGNGPLQWAFALAIIVSVLIGGYFLFRRIRESHA